MKDKTAIDAIARVLFHAHIAVCSGREPALDLDALGHHPAVDSWRAAARAAFDLGARPVRGDGRARLSELLGSDSTNFLGTGLTLREFMELHNAEKLSRSWALQSRQEQQRRLGAVMKLSVELTRVREITSFSTGLAEDAIASVIEGDWKRVKTWADLFSFEDELDRQDYAPIYAVFRELLLQVLRTEKGGST